MGDMLTLIEKAQEDYDEKKAAELEKKMRKNKFTLEDFLGADGTDQEDGRYRQDPGYDAGNEQQGHATT